MGKYIAVDDARSTIVASGSFNAGLADEPGAAYVFSKPDGGWAELDESGGAAAELSVSRGRTDDVFGQYIALSADGSEIAAGRHYRQEGDFRGSVAVFKRPADGWADDNSPDEEYLGDAPGARLGWQPDFRPGKRRPVRGRIRRSLPHRPAPRSQADVLVQIAR